MSSFRCFAAGLELFRALIDRSLSAELVACMKSLQVKSKVTDQQLQDSGLAQALKKSLGLNVLIKTSTSFNAYTYFPTFDKNNPLINEFRKCFFENKDFHTQIALAKDKSVLSGTIDLKTGRVSGIFSEIVSEIYLGQKLLTGSTFTSEEVVAILLHEVGHLITYYAAFTAMVRTNFVLQAVNANDFKTAPVKAKILMMKAIDQAQGVELKDKQILAQSQNEVLVSMIVKEEAIKTRSELGYDFYDQRCSEAMADQFCTFMGMGVPLASALVKLNKSTWTNTRATQVMSVILEFFIVFSTSGSLILADILLGALMVNTYDPTPERIERLKERMIRDLKVLDQSDAKRLTLVREIEQLKKIDPNHYSDFSIGLFIWNHVLPWGRRNVSAVQLQQELERLAHSELYFQSAQLRGL